MKPRVVDISAEPQQKTTARPVAQSKNGTQAPNQVIPHEDGTSGQPRSHENDDPYRLEGLDRVVAIMDLLGESDDCLSLAEICKRMELRKSTAHRSLVALERTGLIERAPGNRYRLGLKLYDMGNRAVEQVDLRARANPYLRKLALRVGETVHLGVLHRTRVVYLDKVEPINRRVCVSSRTGTSNPVYSTSMGKAILANLAPEEASKIISEIQFTSFTSKTISTREELMGALDRVRRRGYAIDDEEMEIGTRCVGAAILDGEAQPIAAISVSGSASRLAAHCVPGIAAIVMRFALDISSVLGDRNPRSLRLGSSPRDREPSSTRKKP